VERDVRQILNVTDLTAFQTFLRLCAGRTGQLLNLSQLGADCGITHNTARAWLSVLETAYVVFRLPPFHSNLKKRLVKTPKLHFYDAGLLCFLLGIRSPDQLINHPMRGAIFESWAVSEIMKMRAHHGLAMDLFHFRDRKGAEVDLVFFAEPQPGGSRDKVRPDDSFRFLRIARAVRTNCLLRPEPTPSGKGAHLRRRCRAATKSIVRDTLVEYPRL